MTTDAMRDVQRLYIETAPLIYYVEENPRYLAIMDRIMNAIENTLIEAFSSVMTLTEVLPQPMRTGNIALAQEYRDILLFSAAFTLLPVTAQIAESAAYLRARYNLRTPDALHVATALDARCDAFLTNDLAIKRVTEIRVLVLDELYDPAPNDEPASTGSV